MGIIRYAYIKNGDVVTQLQHIAQSDTGVITSGPDAFLADFLEVTRSCPVLLVGHGLRSAYAEQNGVIARVLKEQNDLIRKVLARMLAFFSLFIYLLRFKPDRIICGRTGSMLWACFLVSRICSVPLVHSRHNQVIFSSLPWYRGLASALDNWCIRRAKNVICHGPYLRQQLEDIGVTATKIFEFDVGFEDMLADSMDVTNPPEFEELQNSKIILFVGRVQTNKGILDLLDACEPMLKHDLDLKLVYIGAGSDEEILKQHIVKQNLQSKIHLLGEISHAGLAHILSLSHVVVAPTRPDFPEGRCMVVMEALVMNVPVIAPNFGPFPYLITDYENGLLYQPGSVNDLREKLILMLNDRDLYETLKSGARASGSLLSSPALTFGQAIITAFESTTDIQLKCIHSGDEK